METITTSGLWKRATKGTNLYEEEENYDVPIIRNVYVNKAHSEDGGEAPKRIGLIIGEMKEDETLTDFIERIASDL